MSIPLLLKDNRSFWLKPMAKAFTPSTVGG
jgi:hypothetical protein